MLQHFTLTAKVHKGTTPEDTTYQLMAVCEERNEKWTSNSLTAEQFRLALEGSQLSEHQIDEPIRTAKQVEFKAADGKHLLFLEDELHKMKLHRIPN